MSGSGRSKLMRVKKHAWLVGTAIAALAWCINPVIVVGVMFVATYVAIKRNIRADKARVDEKARANRAKRQVPPKRPSR